MLEFISRPAFELFGIRPGDRQSFRGLGLSKVGKAHLTRSINFHAPPECHVTFNIFGFFLGMRIVPGCVCILLSVNFNRVVTGFPFPGAGGMSVAFFEILLIEGSGREVVVAFHDFAVVALS